MASASTRVGTVDADLAAINAVYEELGIASASQRARFDAWQTPQRPPLPMTVVISSTSQPFSS